jgi:hypothetical protein
MPIRYLLFILHGFMVDFIGDTFLGVNDVSGLPVSGSVL